MVHVGRVGCGDRGKRIVGFETGGELVIELRDLVVGHGSHGGKGIDGPGNGSGGDLPRSLRDVQQVPAVLDNHEAIARYEGGGQLRRHDGNPIPPIWNRHTGLERGEISHDANLVGTKCLLPRRTPLWAGNIWSRCPATHQTDGGGGKVSPDRAGEKTNATTHSPRPGSSLGSLGTSCPASQTSPDSVIQRARNTHVPPREEPSPDTFSLWLRPWFSPRTAT